MAYSFSTSGATPSAPQIGPSSYASLQSAGMTPQAKALNLSMASPNTVQPIPISSGNTTGSATPKGLAQEAPPPIDFSQIAQTTGLLPKKQTITNVDGSSHTTEYHPPTNTGDANAGLLGSTQALTPQQMANGNTTGPGSLDPTLQSKPPENTLGTVGTGAPADIAGNQTASGLLGNMVGQSQTLYNQENALNSPFIKQNQDTIDQVMKEEAALAGGAPVGNAAAFGTSLTALEGLKQQAQGNINQAQQNLGTFSGQAQSALGTGLDAATQQVQAPYGTPLYNPLSGKVTDTAGNGASGIVSQWSDYLAKGGDPSQVPSSVSGNSVLWGQVLNGAKASNPNFDVNVSQGAASGKQAIGAAGGTGTAGVLGSIPALDAANTAAQGIANTITTYLQQNPQLNTSPLAAGNAAQQWIQGKQLADPAYQTLFNYLSEYTNTLAPILGVGGDPTNLKTEIAQGFINAQAQGKNIAQVLQSIGQLASDKVKNLKSGATGGGTVAGGGNTSGGIQTPYGTINPDL